jgi:hypothetical protein
MTFNPEIGIGDLVSLAGLVITIHVTFVKPLFKKIYSCVCDTQKKSLIEQLLFA